MKTLFAVILLSMLFCLWPRDHACAAVLFPASPNPNDTVTDSATGAVWIWDGTKWTSEGAGGSLWAPISNPTFGTNNYAPLATPTFSGMVTGPSLTITGTPAARALTLPSADPTGLDTVAFGNPASPDAVIRTAPGQLTLERGAYWNGTNWIATDTTQTSMGLYWGGGSGNIQFAITNSSTVGSPVVNPYSTVAIIGTRGINALTHFGTQAVVAGGPAGPPPTLTNAVLGAESTDSVGEFSTTGDPVTITFGRAFNGNVACVVQTVGFPRFWFTVNRSPSSAQFACRDTTWAVCTAGISAAYICMGIGGI